MPYTRISAETSARIAQAWPGLLDAIAGGSQVKDALAKANISRDMVRAYLRDVAGARQEWDEAREASAEEFFDQAQDIACNAQTDPASARVRLAALQWLASKRNPRVYGERAQLDVNVRTVDLTRIIQDANARLAAAHAGRIIEGVIVRPALESLL
jgi:hypothetical protein